MDSTTPSLLWQEWQNPMWHQILEGMYSIATHSFITKNIQIKKEQLKHCNFKNNFLLRHFTMKNLPITTLYF